MNLQDRLTSFAMLGAEWVMWLLVGLSIICVAIILERLFYFARSRDDAERLQRVLRKHLQQGDTDAALKAMAASPSVEARVAASALGVLDDGPDSVQEHVLGERIVVKTTMERGVAFLGTVGNNAPFVGLLGTVIGIIQAFQALNASAGQVTTGLMATVGEALVATAIGILVALPAVAAYNYFQRIIKTRLSWAEALCLDVLAHLRSTRGEA